MLAQLHERHLVDVEGVREIWLVRHADAYTGINRLGEGILDPPLTPLGRAQAARLAHRLAQVRIDLIRASDMRRAVETAQVIAGVTGRLQVSTDPRLREVRTHWDEGRRAELNAPTNTRSRSRSRRSTSACPRLQAKWSPACPRTGAVVVTHDAAIGIQVAWG